jgi:hypothetical protein
MNPTSARLRRALLGLLVIVGSATCVIALEQPNPLVAGMNANSQQLKKYKFKQLTETYHDGEMKNARIEEVYYSSRGERISIVVEERQPPADPPRRGPGHRLINRKIESEKEKVKETIDRLVTLAGRYLPPDPARLQSAKATKDANSGEVRLVLRDYVKDGDSMILSIDPVTKQPTKTEIHTMLDDASVSIVVVSDQIHDGPNYPAKMVIKFEEKRLELRVLTYDYRL